VHISVTLSNCTVFVHAVVLSAISRTFATLPKPKFSPTIVIWSPAPIGPPFGAIRLILGAATPWRQ
jgi:hypothetical protein